MEKHLRAMGHPVYLVACLGISFRSSMKLTLIVPIYNERIYLPEVFKRIVGAVYPEGITSLEIIAVDDGSDDGSAEWLKTLALDGKCGLPVSLILELNPSNRGKGRCVRQGIDRSTGDFVVIQDADLEYNPSNLKELLEPLLSGSADAVFGSRFLGTPRRVIYFWHAAANRALTGLFNLLFNTTLTDITTGYKVFRGEILRSMILKQDQFGIEVELAGSVALAKLRLFEVGISHHGRTYSEGKKFRRLDAVAIGLLILKTAFVRPSPFKAGMRQTLTALYHAAYLLYAQPLIKLLKKVNIIQKTPSRAARRILEIGSGVGGVTQGLLWGDVVVASDIDEDSIQFIRSRYSFHPGFKAVRWDATLAVDDAQTPPEVSCGGFDLIVAFNVLEHIQNDAQALRQWSLLLAPGGTIVILVPYSQALFSPVDRAVGHYRRYSKAQMENLVSQCGGNPIEIQFWNPIGILGWIWNSKILRRSQLPEGQVALYSLIKPLIAPLEAFFSRWIGLSLVCAARWDSTVLSGQKSNSVL